MVKEVIGKPGVIRAVVDTIIIIVLPQVVDAHHLPEGPQPAQLRLRHAVAQNMKVDAVGGPAPAHVHHDLRVPVTAAKPPDKVIHHPPPIGKGVQLVLAAAGKGAVQGGRGEVGVHPALVPPPGDGQPVGGPLGLVPEPGAGGPDGFHVRPVGHVEHLDLPHHPGVGICLDPLHSGPSCLSIPPSGGVCGHCPAA